MNEIQEIRRENFRTLVENKFLKDYKKLSTELKRSESAIRKYLNKKSPRAMSNSTARDFEMKLDLPTNFLDTLHHGSSKIYYVMLSVEDSETYDLIHWLHDHTPEVVECSAILGQFDILVKVEVANFHHLEKFFTKISRHPYIVRTQTFPSVDSLRWQRDQTRYYSVQNPTRITSYMDAYKNKRIKELLKRIHDIEKGKIVAPENSTERISLTDLMKSTKYSFYSVRAFGEKIFGYSEYLYEETLRISEGVTSKRIFTIPDNLKKDETIAKQLRSTFKQASEIQVIGGEIKFVFEEDWIHRAGNSSPECFAIIDEEYVYVRKEQATKAVLHDEHDYTSMYLDVFKLNWESGITLDQAIQVIEAKLDSINLDT